MIIGFCNMFSIDFARQIGVPGCVQILSGLGQNANTGGGQNRPETVPKLPGCKIDTFLKDFN